MLFLALILLWNATFRTHSIVPWVTEQSKGKQPHFTHTPGIMWLLIASSFSVWLVEIQILHQHTLTSFFSFNSFFLHFLVVSIVVKNLLLGFKYLSLINSWFDINWIVLTHHGRHTDWACKSEQSMLSTPIAIFGATSQLRYAPCKIINHFIEFWYSWLSFVVKFCYILFDRMSSSSIWNGKFAYFLFYVLISRLTFLSWCSPSATGCNTPSQCALDLALLSI